MPQIHCFRPKNGFFCDGGPETLGDLLQHRAKHVFFESSTLKIGWGGLQLTTQAPKNTVLGQKKNGSFWPFLGENAVFLVLAAPKHFITCSNTLQNMFLKREHKSNLYHFACVHWGCILSFQVRGGGRGLRE